MSFLAGDVRETTRLLQRSGGISRGGKKNGGSGKVPGAPLTKLMWFDASDTASFVYNGSNEVSSWTCKVTGTTWSQATTNNKPLYEAALSTLKYKGINFDVGAATRYLTGPAINLPHPFCAFMVVSWPSNSIYRAFAIQTGTATNAINAGAGSGFFMVYSTISGSNNRNMQIMGPVTQYAYTTGTVFTDPSVFEISTTSVAANTTILRSNGSNQVQSTTAGNYTATFSPTTMGSTDSTYTSKGLVGEVVVYAGALTVAQKNAIYSALYSKWIV